MAKFRNLNVKFQDVMRLSVQDRIDMLSNLRGQEILSGFTPAQLTDMFPRYYSEKLPSVGKNLSGIMPSPVKVAEGKAGETKIPSQPATREDTSVQRRERQPSAPSSPPLPSSATRVPDWQKKLEEGSGMKIPDRQPYGTADDKALDLIRKREGFISTPKWDKNAYRVGYGSDTITREDGTFVSVQPGMRITREDAERDLRRRMPQFQKDGIIKFIGEDAWNKLNSDTKAAITSLAYNYGSVANLTSLRKALTENNKESIAAAVESYAEHNNGINRGRRLQEAQMIRKSTEDVQTQDTTKIRTPQNLDPKFVEEFNRYDPARKKAIIAAIGKLGDGDTEKGVKSFNELYKTNPERVAETVTQSATGTIRRETLSEQIQRSSQHPIAATASRQGGVAVAMERMHPEYLRRSAEAQKALKEAGFESYLSSTFRPPEYGTNTRSGSDWSYRSMHGFGLASDWGKVPAYGTKEYEKWADIMESKGFHNPYRHHPSERMRRVEWNHWQITPQTQFARDSEIARLRDAWAAGGYKDNELKRRMWEASGISVPKETKESSYNVDMRDREPVEGQPAGTLAAYGAIPPGTPREGTRPQTPPENIGTQPTQQRPSLPSNPTAIPEGTPREGDRNVVEQQAFALGGETVAQGPLTAYSIDKDKMRRDDTIVTDGRVKFTMNSEKESMKYNPDTGKVQIDQARGEVRQKSNPNELGPEAKAEASSQTPAPVVQEQVPAQQYVPTPQMPAQNSFDTTTSIVDDIFKSASFKRAIASTRFMKDSDPLGGHFDQGAYNIV